jgi:signal transduction histidine kinase
MYASETCFHWLADSLAQLVWTVDASGRLSYGNAAWRARTTIGAGSGFADRYLAALHPQDRPLWKQTWEQALASGEPYAVERRIRFGAESDYVQQVEWGRPIRDDFGRTGEWLVIATDADENERLVAQLQRSLERKEQWLTSIAHEMRGPFAPILGAVQVIGRHGAEPVEIDQACATLTRQVARLLRLVDDLFDLAEVEDARAFLGRATLDLEAVIAGAIDTIRPILTARGHRIEFKRGTGIGVVDGDWRCLNRVFVNLLTNAARYTGDGGRICVSAERVVTERPARESPAGTSGEIPSGGDWVTVKVTDSGAGIPRGMLPRVFDAYVRFERGSGVAHDGPGLGLALTRYLVELHGGTVSVESDGAGQGSEFVVRLPAARAPERPVESRTDGGRVIAAARLGLKRTETRREPAAMRDRGTYGRR